MGRALTIQRTLVTPPERERFHEKLRRKQAYYEKANCRFWVFEESRLPGAFVEFTEADDENSLINAHATAPHRVLDAARIYHELEIG